VSDYTGSTVVVHPTMIWSRRPLRLLK